MGDKHITLFAFHAHGDNQFGPSSISGVGAEDDAEAESSGKSWFGGKGSSSKAADESPDESEAEADDGGLAGLVVALVVLVGIAMLVKKLKGGGGDEEVEIAESDDL